ncbi:MAG: hypothetical protein IT379_25305 [Deltaproteobacteria bacterium]|nr:hypothetical protein [Deltaproteobacteria bacterium]
MPKLSEILLDPATKPAVVRDCVQLIDDEVRDKSGLSGLAVKGAFAVVKALKPNMVEHQITDLLPDFVEKLEPFWSEHQEKGAGRSLEDYVVSRKGEVADALLSITDRRAQRTTNTTIKKTYEKLRPTAKRNCEDAIPRLGRLVERYAKKHKAS